MKYRLKIKQKTEKVKNQKRRVADCSMQPKYTDEEVAKLVDYDYGHLLDMIYYKLDSMRNFFLSKQTHTVNAKQKAKQMLVAMNLIDIINGRSVYFEDEENAPYLNTRNYKRFDDEYYTYYSLRKEKAWHLLFLYLECRMKHWWD